ncbi:uncharacterized protein LOC109824728 isoform X2 [Asparagus officinalis]|uniref:uncharacterized protein LOC109824728 isoform X2 n=1 Tax=Asparagus officinalis TaxID=4686 RepID=UPI00098E788E|nr:uncharacterized protein LOC109824728 isoform X2 [Asparagus officinalis]
MGFSSSSSSTCYFSTSKDCKDEEALMKNKKRVMVLIDESSRAKQAMMWALTHVANRGDLLTLLYVIKKPRNSVDGQNKEEEDEAINFVNSLVSLCKACKSEVEVESLVIKGPKLHTVLNQVKKLEVSVLVVSQIKPSPFSCFFRNRRENLVEQCIERAECLTMAVRKQSKGVGGYLVSTRWQKNFWLLA